LTLLERAGVPEVWRRSVSECLALIDFLDARIAPLDNELRPFAHTAPIRHPSRISLIEVGHRRVQLRSAGVDQHARIGMVDDNCRR
jgi:hypothetical protein